MYCVNGESRSSLLIVYRLYDNCKQSKPLVTSTPSSCRFIYIKEFCSRWGPWLSLTSMCNVAQYKTECSWSLLQLHNTVGGVLWAAYCGRTNCGQRTVGGVLWADKLWAAYCGRTNCGRCTVGGQTVGGQTVDGQTVGGQTVGGQTVGGRNESRMPCIFLIYRVMYIQY